MQTMIDHISAKMQEYTSSTASFMILEAPGLPFYIQIAKVGENFVLDVPTSVLYSKTLEQQLLSLLQDRYRKPTHPNIEKERMVSHQFRFDGGESAKLCYVAQDIFVSLYQMDKTSPLQIVLR